MSNVITVDKEDLSLGNFPTTKFSGPQPGQTYLLAGGSFPECGRCPGVIKTSCPFHVELNRFAGTVATHLPLTIIPNLQKIESPDDNMGLVVNVGPLNTISSIIVNRSCLAATKATVANVVEGEVSLGVRPNFKLFVDPNSPNIAILKPRGRSNRYLQYELGRRGVITNSYLGDFVVLNIGNHSQLQIIADTRTGIDFCSVNNLGDLKLHLRDFEPGSTQPYVFHNGEQVNGLAVPTFSFEFTPAGYLRSVDYWVDRLFPNFGDDYPIRMLDLVGLSHKSFTVVYDEKTIEGVKIPIAVVIKPGFLENAYNKGMEEETPHLSELRLYARTISKTGLKIPIPTENFIKDYFQRGQAFQNT